MKAAFMKSEIISLEHSVHSRNTAEAPATFSQVGVPTGRSAEQKIGRHQKSLALPFPSPSRRCPLDQTGHLLARLRRGSNCSNPRPQRYRNTGDESRASLNVIDDRPRRLRFYSGKISKMRRKERNFAIR